jgi:hypothetical protein
LLLFLPNTPVSASVLSFADNTVSGAGDPIDNQSYVYQLHFGFDTAAGSAADTDLRFYGCRITYTLDQVSP